MSYYVYKHTSPNGKVYIGITKRNPEKRWECGKGYKCNHHFYSAIQKYGWKNFSHEILLSDLTKEQAESNEMRLIKEYQSTDPSRGYNLRLGGSLSSFSEEAIEKMRVSHIGKKLPEEQKRKISLAIKGCKPTYGMRGHKHSEETKEKMRNAAIGRPKAYMKGAKNHRAHSVLNVDTGLFFETIKEASEKYNCNRIGITRCCQGKQNLCGGYRWAYREEVI